MPERRRPVAAVYAPETNEHSPVGTACRPSCCKSPYGHSTVRDGFPKWHKEACHCHDLNRLLNDLQDLGYPETNQEGTQP